MNFEYRIGLRAVKTAIAVLLCLLLAFILNRPDKSLASIAAVVCLQQTKSESLNSGFNRILGTLVGGIAGCIVFLVVKPLYSTENINLAKIVNIALVPIFILIIIYFFNLVNQKSSAQIACIVLITLVAVDYSYNKYFYQVLNRILDTGMGITISVLINIFISSEKFKKVLFLKKISKNFENKTKNTEDNEKK
ncbi:MAG: aromatic acid exporter family protein [Oscillospiraceae bacterium]|nr:aromatic acid exporter family protein [Oscillospiraceae bacterium]